MVVLFTMPIHYDNNGLTRAIIDLGKSLGFTVVAEGVVSKEQFDYLRQHSCD